MFQISTVSPERATGKVAEVYAAFPPEMGVPESVRLWSASPGLLERMFEVMLYNRNHPNLSFALLAAIRYAVSVRAGHNACVVLNEGMLVRMGASPEDLEALRSGTGAGVLEEREGAMLKFTLKALDDPSSVGSGDLDALRAAGYGDSDIFDALAQAGLMLSATLLYRTFARS